MIARLRMRLMCGLACLLASASLTPLFSSTRWVGYVVGCIVVLTTVNVTARLLRCPLAAIPLIDFAVLLLFLSTVFGTGQIAGIIPTLSTIRSLQEGLRAASLDIAALTAPAPAHTGLILVTTAAFGAITAAVDAIAVGLRRPAMAGIPLLLTLVIPAMASPTGVGWAGFSLTALGYLGILLVDDRDRSVRWGPRLTDRNAHPRPGAMLTLLRARAAGPAAAVLAVILALGIPALLPTATGGLSRVTTGSGVGLNGGGDSSRSTQVVDPVTELRGQLNLNNPVELFQLQPSSTEYYLRLTTLDTYTTNRGWSSSTQQASAKAQVQRGLPTPVRGRRAPTQTVTATVTMTGLTSQYLPIYPEPDAIDVRGDWRYVPYSGTVFTTRTNTAGLRYTLRGVELRDSPELTAALKAAPALGAGDPVIARDAAIGSAPEIQRRVDAITAGKRTEYEKTLAIYDYFTGPRSGFVYDLKTRPGSSGDQLLDFLINKHGYCEQYASAMAAMARLAGIPARVAVGYTAGEQQAGGYRSVTTNDAHAWVEVYFDGLGWTTWDPTPASNNGRAVAPSYTSDAAADPTPSASPGSSATPTPSPTTSLSPEQKQQQQNTVTSAPTDGGGRWWPGGRALGWLVVVLVVLAALAAPAAIRPRTRRRRRAVAAGHDPRSAAHAAWHEVLATATDLGLRFDDRGSVRVVGDAVAREAGLGPDAERALHLITLAEERARYSARRAPTTTTLADVVSVVVEAMVQAAAPAARLRARAFPLSVLLEARSRFAAGIRRDQARHRGSADPVSGAVDIDAHEEFRRPTRSPIN